MDSAEVYLTLLRPSMVPVFGEASPIEFTGQIELATWSWNIHNEEESKRAAAKAQAYADSESKLKSKTDALNAGPLQRQLLELEDTQARKELKASIKQIQASGTELQKKQLSTLQEQLDHWDASKTEKLAKFDKELRKTLGQAQQDAAELALEKKNKERDKAIDDQKAKIEEAIRNKNFEFTFSKRVDVATTQMLNSMKAGDVFPTAVMTIHQRSSNSGLSLIFTVQKLRLLDYALKCETSDTMTDMREEWKAEFYSLAYVYKNRKAIKKASGAGQMVAQAATQGTVRAFAMKNIGLPI